MDLSLRFGGDYFLFCEKETAKRPTDMSYVEVLRPMVLAHARTDLAVVFFNRSKGVPARKATSISQLQKLLLH